MAATLALLPRPASIDNTQRKFTLNGNLTLSGNYTNGTGLPINFSTITDSVGNAHVIPPTYTGVNGPGQGVPTNVAIQGIAGYGFSYAGGNVKIYSGTTELATGALPAAIAGPLPAAISFLRG